MSIDDKTLYIDVEELHQRYEGAIGLCITDDSGKEQVPIFTGKVILSMPVKDKQEKAYEILAEEYDVRFIFDNAIPELKFYPIPQLNIFAIDSLGGCFASTNAAVDVSQNNAPIYYVNKELQCYCLAENLLSFIHLIVFQPDWKKGLVKDGDLTMAPSLEGKEYLIDTLKIDRDQVASGAEIELAETITIFESFKAAKKVIAFFDISELVGGISVEK